MYVLNLGVKGLMLSVPSVAPTRHLAASHKRYNFAVMIWICHSQLGELHSRIAIALNEARLDQEGRETLANTRGLGEWIRSVLAGNFLDDDSDKQAQGRKLVSHLSQASQNISHLNKVWQTNFVSGMKKPHCIIYLEHSVWLALGGPTPRKYTFSPCGRLEFESAVTAQSDDSRQFCWFVLTFAKR